MGVKGRPFGQVQQTLLAALRKRAHSLDELVALTAHLGVDRARLTVLLGNLKHRGYVRHAGQVRSKLGGGWQSIYAIVLVSAPARQQLRQARRVGRVGQVPAAIKGLPAWLSPPPSVLASIPASAPVRRVTGVASVAERTAAMDDDRPGAIARALARVV